MAAPSETSWASVINDKGRIGLYVGISNTNTTTTVTIHVWFWSKWGCSDQNNDLYFNNDATSATTLIGPVTIRHSVSSGSGWSTSNQTKLMERTYSYARRSNAQTKYCAVNLKGIDAVGAQMTHSVSYTVPELPSYIVSYNANGGTGAPSKQTKWYGVDLTLSSTKPSRSYYSFLGWSTSSSATSASYSAGGSYTANSSATLYAVWKGNTYTITYNANGGTGAPSKQSYTYASSGSVNLSSTEPTRTNYNFLGWARSSSATSAEYSAGQAWAKSNGANYTLYAVWELAYTAPRITNVVVERANSSGTHADDGTYFNTSFNWETDKDISSIKIICNSVTTTVSASGTSGSVSETALGSGSLSTESNYTVTITVADTTGSSTITRTLPALAYAIDFLSGGGGVAIGKPASQEGILDCDWPIYEEGEALSTKYAPADTRICYDWTGSGYYKIKILSTAYWMLSFTIRVYQGYVPTDIQISGYNYTDDEHWFSPRARVICGTSNMTVYFGYDSVRNLWVGIPAGDYTALGIYDVTEGYKGTGVDLHSLFSVERMDSLTGTLQSTVTAYCPVYKDATDEDYYLGSFRFNSHPWMGLYSDVNHSTRMGWIGYNKAKTHIVILNTQAGGGIELNALNSTYRIVFYPDASDGSMATVRAVPTGKIYLGNATYKWNAVYAATGTIQTSDRDKKKDFAEFDERYEGLFFDLKPTLYRLIDNTSNRIHSGFVAQDIEKSLEDNGLTALDFAAFCKDKAKNVGQDEDGNDVETYKLDEDGNQVYDYSLRYEEFIALNTHMLQKAYAKIDEQQAQIDSLQAQIDELKQLLASK